MKKGKKIVTDYVQKIKEDLTKDKIYYEHAAKDATYKLIAEKDHLRISFAADDRPLIKQVNGYGKHSLEKSLNYLRQISKWEFIKNLKPETSPDFWEHPIKMTIHIAKQGKIEVDYKNPVVKLEHPLPDETGPRMKFYFENTSDYDLYLACMYMDASFGVEIDYLEPPVVMLESMGRGVWALNNGAIRPKMPDYIHEYKWKEEVVYLKLIIAEQALM